MTPEFITPEGRRNAALKLKELKTQQKEIAEHFRGAEEQGGSSINNEVIEARKELDRVNEEITHLERIIRESDFGVEKKDAIYPGAVVTIRTRKNEIRKYTIVGSDETDPWKDKISHKSPLGQALLGKRPGEIAEVKTKNGKTKVEIISFE